METADKLKQFIIEETSKCIYCGFCEPVCPTLPPGRHRGYGPRGRVNLARMIVTDNIYTEGDLESIYTCLLCGACHTACPARIDIVGVIRATRVLISSDRLG